MSWIADESLVTLVLETLSTKERIASMLNGLSIERQVSEFYAEVPSEDIADDAIRYARLDVAWTLATGIAGAYAHGGESVRRAFALKGGRPESTVWGYGDKCAAADAALVNGASAKALEYEDKYWMDYGHGFAIGPSVVPAAMAIAEASSGISGRALLDAVALAMDFQCRLLASTPDVLRSPWNGTYLHAHFGATVAVGRLVGLSADEMQNALGLAYAQLAGNWQSQVDPSTAVRIQAGFAARNALHAVDLAAEGVTATKEPLTGTWGFYRAFFRDQVTNPGVVTEDLGKVFAGTKISFKAHPCGLVAHSPLDALASAAQAGGFDPSRIDEVAAIEVDGTHRMQIMLEPESERRQPTSHVGAEFSLPWVLASALKHGRLRLDFADDEALRDASVRRLAQRVHVSTDRSPDQGVRVRICMSDGTVHASELVVVPKGHRDNPITESELHTRFVDCLTTGGCRWSEEKAQELWNALAGLEAVDDIGANFPTLS